MPVPFSEAAGVDSTAEQRMPAAEHSGEEADGVAGCCGPGVGLGFGNIDILLLVL